MKLPEINPINFSNVKKDDLSKKPLHSTIQLLSPPSKINIANTHQTLGSDKKSPVQWDIIELEDFFKNAPLPSAPVKLNPWTTIIDISLFITSHLDVIKVNNGIKNYEPYYTRLFELKRFLLLNIN